MGRGVDHMPGRVFRSFDEDKNGTIDRGELQRGLSTLGVDMTADQLEDVFTILDKEGGGEIEYATFAQWFGTGPPPPPIPPQVRAMAQAQQESKGSTDRDQFLKEIAAASRRRVPLPPPTPEVTARQNAREAASNPAEHLAEIKRVAVAKAEKRSWGQMLALKAELSAVFKVSGASIERTFREFDQNGDGVVDSDELQYGLEAMGVELSTIQLQDIMSLLDKDGDGSIDMSEFGRWFGSGPPPPPMTPEVALRETARKEAMAAAGDSHADFLDEIALGAKAREYRALGIPAPPPGAPPAFVASPQSASPRPGTASHAEAIQAAAEKRSRQRLLAIKARLGSIFKQTSTELQVVFRSFDLDHNGAIDREELQQGLAKLDVGVTPAEVNDFFDILDRDGDGEIDYSEFARWFGKGAPPPPVLPQVRDMEIAKQEAMESGGGIMGERRRTLSYLPPTVLH